MLSPDRVLPDAYFDRFDTPKYRSKNPVQRALIRAFVAKLHALFVAGNPAQRVLEVGVGEGFLSGWLSERFPEKSFTGIDLAPEDVERLRAKFPRVEAHQGSIYDLASLSPPYDLVLCCEVLEHLPDPARGLDQLASLGARRLILTVPHEPLFMLSNLARGKNVARLGNDPEHVNHWGKASFRRLLASRFDVLELTTSYPWLLALCAPRGSATD
jgi:2-polyprenyl-3-methyl-5-hydroxy-6-metoxy-1,4-benzoquinol methylase